MSNHVSIALSSSAVTPLGPPSVLGRSPSPDSPFSLHRKSHPFADSFLSVGDGDTGMSMPADPRVQTASPAENATSCPTLSPAVATLRRYGLLRGRGSVARRTAPQRAPERAVNAMSVLDLAGTDLDQLKRSFVFHAQAIHRGELVDIQRMSLNVMREMRHMERLQRRRQHQQQQQLGRSISVSRPRLSFTGQPEGGADMGASVTSTTMESSSTTIDPTLSGEAVSQRVRLMNVWLYDLVAQARLRTFATAKKGKHAELLTSGSPTGLFPGGTKAVMPSLRGPPMPSHVSGLDVFDRMGEKLREVDPSVALTKTEVSPESLELPLPVFVYVFSRALFRLYYLSRFSPETFSASENENYPSSLTAILSLNEGNEIQPAVATTPATAAKGTAIEGKNAGIHIPNPFVGKSVNNEDGESFDMEDEDEDACILSESITLLDNCRRAVFQFFDLLDTEKSGTITWSSFTDALMEQVEVQHRVLKDFESSEEVVQSGAKVFDEYVVEPFPSVLRRLGYVGAVTEVRHSGSAVVIEGPHDFALCDSAFSGLIHRKLLVRGADVLFSHRKNAIDPWDAERWDAAVETSVLQTREEQASRKFKRFEDGRREEVDTTLLMSTSDHIDREKDADGARTGRMENRRIRPGIEGALQIRGVAPDLPTVVLTLHRDLILRFFHIEQHLWVVPETFTLDCRETLTAMEWCDMGPGGDPTLKTFLYIGTRAGFICRLDLLSILREIAAAKCAAGDIFTTGAAAAATVRERLEAYVLQRNATHTEFVTSLCLTGNGTLLSSSLDGTVALSRAANLVMLRSFRADHDAGIRFACITPLRQIIVTLSTGNRVSLWGNAHQSSSIDLYDPLGPHYFPIVAIRVDERMDQLITIDSSGYAKVWSLRRSLPSASFYAVSDQCFSAFRQMYSGEKGDAAQQRNGFRLFDMDEGEKRRPRMATGESSGSTVSGGGLPGLLQITLASIEMANKARLLHPVRHVAYDYVAKRFFVSGIRNNVMCVFAGGSTAVTAHTEPLCHLAVCERNRWLISTSFADCRVWRFRTGKLTLGIKANSPEFVVARVAPAFAGVVSGNTNSPVSRSRDGGKISTTFTGDLTELDFDGDRPKLDACKQPLPTLQEVMRAVSGDALRRRLKERAGFAGSVYHSNGSGTHSQTFSPQSTFTATGGMSSSEAMNATGGGRGGTLKNNITGGGSSNDHSRRPHSAAAAAAAGSSGGADACSPSSAGSKNTTIPTGEDDASDNQSSHYKIVCAHVDCHERFIFYAMRSGDIRVHRTDSGRLLKTLVTLPPSTDLIFASVFQSRHLFSQAKRPNGDPLENTFSDDGDPLVDRSGTTSSVAPARLQDVAFMLQQLLRAEEGVTLQARGERNSIHREAIGLMTPHGTQELGVVYADGVIRFFPLVGNSVHAQRLVIPEFLVAKAVSCLRSQGGLLQSRPLPPERKSLFAKSNTSPMAKKRRWSPPRRIQGIMRPVVEADAVSLITVSRALDLLCMVQVNGRISLMDMSTQAGTLAETFTVSTEVTAVTFLGSLPCLVLADVHGCVSFFLTKGSSTLALLEDFFKAVVVHRRQLRERPLMDGGASVFGDSTIPNDSDVGKASSSGTSRRIWWFRTVGIPSALHFDTTLYTLYVGTRQGYVSSYLVRNLIAAFDLHPVISNETSSRGMSNVDSIESRIVSIRQRQKESNERRICNVLLVLFGITVDRAMRHIENSRSNAYAQWRSTTTPPPAFGQSVRPSSSMSQSLTSRKVTSLDRPTVSWQNNEAAAAKRPPDASVTSAPGAGMPPISRMWRSSLSWIYEWCKPLFYTTPRGRQDNSYFFDLRTATLSDLFIATAIVHHTLLVLASKQSESGACPSAVLLSSQDLRHIRQSIYEELIYQKESTSTNLPDDGRPSPRQAPSMLRFRLSDISLEPMGLRGVNVKAEGELDIDILDNDLGELPLNLTGDWVEFLFRRHIILTRDNSPLTFLSPSGALERARRERYERGKLLRLQCNLEPRDETIGTGESASESFSAGTNTTASPCSREVAISVDWNAYIEGSAPDAVADVLRRRRAAIPREEEALNRLEEGEGVRSIATRRNGLLFIGSGDGTVSLWTPYACARVDQLCPSVLLEGSVRRIGATVKAQLSKFVQRVIREKQRQAYTSRGYDTQYHEKLMRNLYLGYKVAVLKSEAARAKEAEKQHQQQLRQQEERRKQERASVIGVDSPAKLDGPSKSSLSVTVPHSKPSLTTDGGTHHGGGYAFSSCTSISFEGVPDRAMRRRIMEGEREMLLAVLGMAPARLSVKGLLMEDLFFLPMQVSLLAELEDFSVPAYEAAVDFAMARLVRELRGEDALGLSQADGIRAMSTLSPALATGSVSGTATTHLPNDVAAGIPTGAEDRVFGLDDMMRGNDPLEDEAANEAALQQLITHERHLHAFFHEQQHRLRVRVRRSSRSRSVLSETCPPRRRSRVGRTSLMIDEGQLPSAASTLPPELVSWIPPAEASLPSWARPGTVGTAGAITLSTTTRRERRLLGCHALDLARLTESARWVEPAEALQHLFPGGGADALGGLGRAAARRPAEAPPSSAEDDADGATVPAEPLVLLRAAEEEEDLSMPQWEVSGPRSPSAPRPKRAAGAMTSSVTSSGAFGEAAGPCAPPSMAPQGTALSTSTANAGGALPAAAASSTGKKRLAFFITEPSEVPHRGSAQAGVGVSPERPCITTASSDYSDTEETMADAPIEWTLASKKHSHRAQLARTGSVAAHTHTRTGRQKGTLGNKRHGESPLGPAETSLSVPPLPMVRAPSDFSASLLCGSPFGQSTTARQQRKGSPMTSIEVAENVSMTNVQRPPLAPAQGDTKRAKKGKHS